MVTQKNPTQLAAGTVNLSMLATRKVEGTWPGGGGGEQHLVWNRRERDRYIWQGDILSLSIDLQM